MMHSRSVMQKGRGCFFPYRLTLMQRELGEKKSTGVLQHLLKWGCLHAMLLSQHGRGCQFFDSSVAVSSPSLLAVAL